MPKKIKQGKARLDKWYRIAKEQGYRSRAAFKLIQLNRKYNFLNNAQVLVDLCAAPGGWLQVATRYMPAHSIKIGIDLVSIKHIPGVITFQEDITTPKCLALIKKEVKGEKVDVVLNDGAPNVGANWSKDAFTQVELVLASLKLACTVLRKGGTLVTKVFRSADYNSLIWVLNKFFEKVEATKPAASRTQSAEIFIVCLRYIAPDYIDPKLFDTKFVFQDTEGDLVNEANEDHYSSIDKLLQKKRNRQGYDKDMPVGMHKIATFEEFLTNEVPLSIFAKCNQISFTAKDEEKYLSMAQPAEDYKDLIADLKVLGKREIQALLKWRSKVNRVLAKNKKKTEKEGEGAVEEEKAEGEHDTDSELEEEVKKQKKEEIKINRREKEKKITQLSKLKDKVPEVVEANDEIGFDFTKGKNIERLGFVDVDDDEEILAPVEKKKKRDNRDVEENIELLYELKKKGIAGQESRRLRREEEKKARKFDPNAEVDEEDLQLETLEDNGLEKTEFIDGIEIEKAPTSTFRSRNMEEEDGEDADDADYEDIEEDNGESAALAKKTLNKSRWFDRDIFKQGLKTDENLENVSKITNPLKLSQLRPKEIEEEVVERKVPKKKINKGKKVEDFEDQDFEDISDEEDQATKTKKKSKISSNMKEKEKRRRKLRQDALDVHDEHDDGKIEVVPQLRYDDYDVDALAEMRVLAQKMLRKKDRDEIIDSSYNRYSRPIDEDAPDWFLEDEEKHSHKIMPITKEEFQIEKTRLYELKNKPIKKILEAKFRRKMQVAQKLKKAQNKAKDIMEQEGVTETSKLKQVKSLYKKAMATKKVEKKYIVSRRHNDSSKLSRKTGRNTRMVDSRLKKDKRAVKNKEKRGGTSKIHKKSKKRMVNRRR